MGAFTKALDEAIAGPVRHQSLLTIGDTSREVYAYPMTGLDLDWISRKHKGFMQNPKVEGIVDLLIRKVKLVETDEAAFDLKDKPRLMRMGVDWIMDAKDALMPEDDADFSDEAVKTEMGNSKTDPA